MEFLDQSWNFKNFAFSLIKFEHFFADIEKLSISLESPHFPTFSAKLSSETVMEN